MVHALRTWCQSVSHPKHASLHYICCHATLHRLCHVTNFHSHIMVFKVMSPCSKYKGVLYTLYGGTSSYRMVQSHVKVFQVILRCTESCAGVKSHVLLHKVLCKGMTSCDRVQSHTCTSCITLYQVLCKGTKSCAMTHVYNHKG